MRVGQLSLCSSVLLLPLGVPPSPDVFPTVNFGGCSPPAYVGNATQGQGVLHHQNVTRQWCAACPGIFAIFVCVSLVQGANGNGM